MSSAAPWLICRGDLIHGRWRVLCGRALDGVSEEYTNKLMIEKGPAMCAAQEKISARMFELLGLTLDSQYEAPVAPEAPTHDGAAAKRQSRRIDIGHQCLSTSDASEN